MQTLNPTDPLYPTSAGLTGGESSTSTSRAGEMAHKAAAAIDSKRETIARGIDSAAATLRGRADTSFASGRVTDYALTAADALEATADYVRGQNVEGMLADAGQVARRHPGAVLITAAAVGFMLMRALTRR